MNVDPSYGPVETDAGPTFVRKIGSGPIVFVVHGGPGFDHRYLVPSLQELAQRRTLVFFDQPGCGQTPRVGDLTAADTFRHFAALRHAIAADAPAGLIAHSWGALVAIASTSPEQSPFSEGLLITPVPLTNHEYEVCRANLLGRVPADKFAEFERLASMGDGESIVRLLLPYYFAPGSQAKMTGLHIAMATFAAVTASMASFDYTANLASVGHLNVVLGEYDFTPRELVSQLVTSARRVDLMRGVGHFPSAEDPGAFAKLLEAAFPN